MAGITDPVQRERVRYHLGYPTVQIAATIQLGIPTPVQTLYLVDATLNSVPAETIPRIMSILNTMDNIECLLREVAGHVAVSKSGNTELRENEGDLIEEEYAKWQGRLSDLLGAPPYPYSNRTKRAYGVMTGSLSVRG